MAVITYIVPVVDRPFGDTWSRDPEGIDIIKAASGFQRVSMHHPAGNRLPVSVITVRRDTLSNAAFEAAVPNAIKLADEENFAALFNSTAPVPSGQRRTRINSAASALGVDLTDLSDLGDLIRRFWRRLEPNARADMYDYIPQTRRATITDDFNRTDGDLGANWEEVEGTDWVVSSNAARYTGGATFATARRTESTFPDNQYVQCEIEKVDPGDGTSSPAARVGGTGTCYLVHLQDTALDLRYHTGGGGYTGIDSISDSTSNNTFLTVRITCTGSSIVVAREGSDVITATDSNVTSGKPGMLAIFANADFDDWESTDASGGGGGSTFPGWPGSKGGWWAKRI